VLQRRSIHRSQVLNGGGVKKVVDSEGQSLDSSVYRDSLHVSTCGQNYPARIRTYLRHLSDLWALCRSPVITLAKSITARFCIFLKNRPNSSATVGKTWASHMVNRSDVVDPKA
jgi:hypothetical protein